MADTGPVVLAYRKIGEDKKLELWLGFSAGVWTLESRSKVPGRPMVQQIDLAPAAMEDLIAQWPKFRKEIGQ